jgi:hypothetical protein
MLLLLLLLLLLLRLLEGVLMSGPLRVGLLELVRVWCWRGLVLQGLLGVGRQVRLLLLLLLLL